MHSDTESDRYLPIPGIPPAKYECLGGKLITSPRGGTADVFAVCQLGEQLETAAEQAGHHSYLTVGALLDVQKWIEFETDLLFQLSLDPAELLER